MFSFNDAGPDLCLWYFLPWSGSLHIGLNNPFLWLLLGASPLPLLLLMVCHKVLFRGPRFLCYICSLFSPFKDIYIQEVFSNFMKRKQKSLLVYLTDSFHFCQIFCQEPLSSFCFHLSLWMFKFKISFLVHSCFYHLRNTVKLISSTSRSEMEIVIHAFISSHLSYCGSLFACLKKASLERLQVFQNTTARLLTQFSKNSHVTELLIHVHFVPIYLRVHFKFLVFSY